MLALAGADARVTILELPPGTPAIEALNRALAARTGAVAGLLAPGDTLAPTALHEAVLAFGPETLLVYTDGDQAILPAGERRHGSSRTIAPTSCRRPTPSGS